MDEDKLRSVGARDDGGGDGGEGGGDGGEGTGGGNDNGGNEGGQNQSGGGGSDQSGDQQDLDRADITVDDRLGYFDENGTFVGVSVFSLGTDELPPPEPDTSSLFDRGTGDRGQATQYRLGGTEYMDVAFLGLQNLFRVTSTTGDSHNRNSTHYLGWSVDFGIRDMSTEQIEAFIQVARLHGFTVRDERTHPPGQRVWSGPHLHITNAPRPDREYHLLDMQIERPEGSSALQNQLFQAPSPTPTPTPTQTPAIEPDQQPDISLPRLP